MVMQLMQQRKEEESARLAAIKHVSVIYIYRDLIPYNYGYLRSVNAIPCQQAVTLNRR
jgi:hypothetical protein